MTGANPLSSFGGLGAPELLLVAAIVLLLAVGPLLFSRGRQWTETIPARAYLDRLFGPAPAQSLRPMAAIRGQA